MLFRPEEMSPRLKKVNNTALNERDRTGSFECGSEHFLLGLVVETDSVASRILRQFGVNAEVMRGIIINNHKRDRIPPNLTIVPYSPEAKELKRHVMEHADRRHVSEAQTEDLLWTLMTHPVGLTNDIIIAMRIPVQEILEKLGTN